MYYEEKIIRGVLSFRTEPNGEWTPFRLEKMTKKWELQKQNYEKLLTLTQTLLKVANECYDAAFDYAGKPRDEGKIVDTLNETREFLDN